MSEPAAERGTHLEYEKTVMYGRYSQLQQFAKEYATQRKKAKPPGIKEAKRMKSRTWKVWKFLEANILPYIIDWLFILILGILMACLSFGLDFFISKISLAHRIISFQFVESPFVQYIFWVAFSVILVLFAVSIVQAISTHAIGSGIPEMKTVLRGIHIPGYLSFRTFISKALGLMAAVGAGLPIGKEGPFVHLSSIIASLMSKLIGTVNTVYSNETHNSELLAAACAIGVSCNFAAPIGGVLFSIEVTSTYFAVRNYWRGFFGAVCGAFLFRLAAVAFGDEATITALFKTSFQPDYPFDLLELLAFSFIGVISGLVGALFVWYHRNYVELRRSLRKYTKLLNKHVFIVPIVVTFVYTSLTFQPGLGQFMAGELSQHESVEQLFSNKTWSELVLNKVDELPLESEDYRIVRQWGSPNIWVSLILFLVVRFIFTVLSVSLPIPSGVFFPVFIIGAAFGRLIGEAMGVWFPSPFGINGNVVSPGGYAVVGAASLAGAVTHTISTSVIVFELTGQITHILPVMISVLIANLVAGFLQPSIYDDIILLKGLSYLPDLKRNKIYKLCATDIMQSELVFLSYQSTYREMKFVLQTSRYSSYPLVDSPDSRILIGSVSRNTLKDILEEHMSGVHKHAQQIREQALLKSDTEHEDPSKTNTDRSSSPPRLGESLSRKMSSVPHSLAKMFMDNEDDEPDSTDAATLSEGPSEEALEQLRDELLSRKIDLNTALIDPAPFQLVERTSLYKVHSLFSILALKHAYVTSIGKLVGVVTLNDLAIAIRGRTTTARSHVFRLLPSSDTEESENTVHFHVNERS